jgi:hypothetical protein
MSLFESAQESLTRLNNIEETRDGAQEANVLDGLRSDLSRVALIFKQLAGNAKLLHREGVHLSTIPELTDTIKSVQNVASRFSEVPKSTTLKSGTRWSGLINKLDGLAKNVAGTQERDWGIYFVDNFSVGLPPEQRRKTLAQTPENIKSLESYSDGYMKYIRYKSEIPRSSDEFNSLKELWKQLEQIKFQVDVPADVQKFFEATSTGASLDLLTNDVIEWLRRNKLLASYIVRAR